MNKNYISKLFKLVLFDLVESVILLVLKYWTNQEFKLIVRLLNVVLEWHLNTPHDTLVQF